MVRDFTALGSTGVLTIITLGVVGWLMFSGKRKTAAGPCRVLCGVVFSSLLKSGFARPRPDLVPHSVAVFTSSFPSGHAMMSAVVYLTLGSLVPGRNTRSHSRVYVLSLALFSDPARRLSRIYLGVHWPSDVLAGGPRVRAGHSFARYVVARLQEVGKVEPETPSG